MKLNRVWIAVVLIVAASVFYELQLRSQSRPLYESALARYHQGNYSDSLADLERAHAIDPNSTGILVLMGWNYLKLGKLDEAENNFSRASHLDPNLVESRLGENYVAIETGNGETASENIRALLKQDPNNPDFRLAAAAALRQAGKNGEAATLFQSLLNDNKLGKLARKNLEEMYGIENLNEAIPAGFSPLQRASALGLNFRANGRYLQRRVGNSWENFYVKGVDIDPGTPGHFSSEAPVLAEEYLQWFEQISRLGANTIRVYAAMPPVFYRALQRHNADPSAPRLYLLQEIRLAGSEDSNPFAPNMESADRLEIGRVIDLVHGQGDLPMRKGYANGLYAVDVSEFVLGFVLNRDLPPHLVEAINRSNPAQTSYTGQYISIPKGNASEVWLASLMDYAVHFEMQKYNVQHPLGFANNASLDPLTHPSESSIAQEITNQHIQGDRTAAAPVGVIFDDNDSVSLDETRLEVRSEYQGGIFAAYSVFPFDPDFMYRDPAYLNVRDSEGANPFFGYLKALKTYESKMPLLILEYGIPTSIGVSHFASSGWNDGGLTEREQGDALARMTRNIAAAGCAGGLVFEWQDEWYKANWLPGALAIPTERRPLWNNRLDPDQGFGLMTYDPVEDARLFSGLSGWKSLPALYSKDRSAAITLNDGWDTERALHSLSVSSDAAFVYLRLQVGSIRKGLHDIPDLKGANYFIGINTAPKRFGGQVLPGLVPQVRTENGANFLLHIADGGHARLLIASNYNPREARPEVALTPTTRTVYRIPFESKLVNWSGFDEMVVEPNRRRFSPDGHLFPAQRYSQSLLRYRPSGDSDDTVATWTADYDGKAFIFRIPWGLLMVTDPSSHQVLAYTGGGPKFETLETGGMDLFAVAYRPGDPIQFQQIPSGGVPAVDSLPALANGVLSGVKAYSWPRWNDVKIKGRLKSGFASVQKAFRELGVPPS